MRSFARVFFAAFLLAAPVQAADIAGSADHPLLKRFSGAEIIGYSTKGYDEYTLALGNGTPNNSFDKFQGLEGKLTRIIYRVAGGHTTIELFRNYEKHFRDNGFEPLFSQDAQSFAWYGYFSNRFYLQSRLAQGLANGEVNPYSNDTTKESRYLAAKKNIGGKDSFVAVLITESKGLSYRKPGSKDDKDAIAIAPGDLVVAVDVIETDSVADNMVQVKAEDLAKALEQSGKVDIYGIYFDTDKATLKPESAPTLEQVAKLLKDNAALKLQVGGHTDNSGAKEHNQTLSEARAKAVMDALTGSPYGIDAARLQAKGFGDTKPVADNGTDAGKAKNRRVELSKL